MERPYITPKMKVYELLKEYPEIEEFLIDLVPEFKKLKNPILRKTITRVTTLEQASKVGGISVEKLINNLRNKVGQNMIQINEISSNTERPNWLVDSKIIKTMDLCPIIEAGDHPIGLVLSEVDLLKEDEILEIITPFYPAPMVDMIVGRGIQAYSDKINFNLIKTFFTKL
ncbi:MAG: hypothetical protein A2X64_01395 [Ignavibacteria bacterium GWF2_33_9]|nr:MAG: hypothetical protein A2X64_01395 [Ignavibacteria bacterium GWF2_33_9]